MLDEVYNFLGRFTIFPSKAAHVAVALWAAHTHVLATTQASTPRLALLSPEPESGKTRTLETLALLVARPLSVVTASSSAIYRSIQDAPRTIIQDEADAIWNGKDPSAEALRAIYNSGHRPGIAALRCVGPLQVPTEFDTYSPVVFAGLGLLPDTIMSRAIVVRMQRRLPGQKVEPFRDRTTPPEGHAIRERLQEWCASIAPELGNPWPTLPAGIEDRAADCWELLIALADAAGGPWPSLGRDAAIEMVKVREEREQSLGIKPLETYATSWGVDRKSSPKHSCTTSTLWRRVRGGTSRARR